MEMDFEDAEVGTDEEKLERLNIARHLVFIDKVLAAEKTSGRVKVPTGTIITSENKRASKKSLGRGTEEYKDEQAFKAAARERGLTARVQHEHLPDGKTQLRMRFTPKREMNEKAMKALAKYRAEKTKAKAADNGATQAPAPKVPTRK